MPPATSPLRRRPGRLRRATRILLRRGTGHAFGVAHNLVNVVLLALALLFGSVLMRDHLPLPDLLRARIQREFAIRGFTVAVDGAEINATATIVARGVTLAPDRFGGPVLSAERVLVELDRLQLFAGRIAVVGLAAEDVRVICPASLSPSGQPRPIVEIASIRVTHHEGVWRVPGMIAAVGPVHVVARGFYHLPPRDTPASLPTIDAWLDQFAELAPRLVRELARLDGLEEPRLNLGFSGGTDRPLTIDAAFTAAGWREARGAEARGIRARTRLVLGRGPATPVRLSAEVDRIDYRDTGSAEGVELLAEWLAAPTAQNFLPWQVHAAAARVRHPQLTMEAPVLAVFPLAYPLIDLEAAVVLEGQPLTLTAEGDVRSRSGTLEIHGVAAPHWPARASEILGRNVNSYATITTPPDFSARATIAPGLAWQTVEFRTLASNLVARNVSLDRARVRGIVTRDRVQLDHLEASRGEEFVRGTYTSDFIQRDYRFRLAGAMRPLAIAGWFGPWWPRFWQDYAFNGPAPAFDVDALGNWLKREPVLISGSGAGESVTYRGIPFTQARTRFFIRPNYYDLFDATLLRPEGRVDGAIQLRVPRGQMSPTWQAFRFSSTADLVELARVFGPGGEALLAPYRYTVPPAATIAGTVQRTGGTYDVRLDIGLNTAEEFRYLDFPLEWLTTRVSIHNDQVALPEIYAGYARGVMVGSAHTAQGRLTFDARLTNADFDRAVKTYSDFSDRNFPTPPAPVDPGSPPARTDYGGTLNLTLAAAGPINNLKAFDGEGDFALTGAELYQLKAIGIFSNILGTGLGVLDFTDASGPLLLRRDRIHFPDLRVTGKTALLEASGDYLLEPGALDFRVRMKPLDQSTGFITKIFGRIVDPLTKLLFEARLTGTLRNPRTNVGILAPRALEPEVVPVPVTSEPLPLATP